MTDAGGQLLHWDSDFFGFPVGLVARLPADDAAADALQAWCEQNTRCTYARVPAHRPDLVRRLELVHFRHADVRVDLQTDKPGLTAASAAPVSRSWRADDLEALGALAAVAHQQTRFWQDGNFPRERVGELYRTWMRNACAAENGFVLVAGDKPIAGYVSATVESAIGRIGLVAVTESARGLRLGTGLLTEACSRLASMGATTVRVATQGGNLPALRLYESLGFRVHTVEVTLHRWTDPPA
ncbi:MAG: dTDP-4-amino-4,6-dideoxy-D-galactose acyltransferase [Candidatus Dormibacteria bacterium]